MYAGLRTNRHAFTVIELMVVLTILTLLMGILIPAVSNARRQARRQVVATQLQHLGQACDNYCTAFGAFPGPVPDDIAAAMPGRSVTDTSISENENLALGLFGCMLPAAADRDQATDPRNLVTFAYDSSITGPYNRIPVRDAAGQWHGARNHLRFYDPHPDELADPDGDGLPELVARGFGNRPILYYRAQPARTGRLGLRSDKAEAAESAYDYRQNGLPEHGYGDPYEVAPVDPLAPPTQERLAAMLRDAANAPDPAVFQSDDPCYRPNSFVLISTGADERYADNTRTQPADLIELAPAETDNITNFP